MVFHTRRVIGAPPEEVWPWLVQLGKRRAGWYLPRSAERFLPPSRRALRVIDARWQDLAVGDSVPDYGGREETLEVIALDPPRELVFASERRGATFTWALRLHPGGGRKTLVHLEFRGSLRSTGLKRKLIAGLGEVFDRATGELMLRGLAERVA